MTATLPGTGFLSGVGTVGAHDPVSITPVYREGRDLAPALVSVCVSVPMSADDLVGLLWRALRFDDWDARISGWEADATVLHREVLEGLIALSGFEIEEARLAVLTAEGEHVPPADVTARLYALVARHYGSTVPAPRTERA